MLLIYATDHNRSWRHVESSDMLPWLSSSLQDLAGDDVIVFIDSWPLICLNILLATNQISNFCTHGNPVDFTKGSPNISKGELLAGEDV
jgi:hypothetical protein